MGFDQGTPRIAEVCAEAGVEQKTAFRVHGCSYCLVTDTEPRTESGFHKWCPWASSPEERRSLFIPFPCLVLPGLQLPAGWMSPLGRCMAREGTPPSLCSLCGLLVSPHPAARRRPQCLVSRNAGSPQTQLGTPVSAPVWGTQHKSALHSAGMQVCKLPRASRSPVRTR